MKPWIYTVAVFLMSCGGEYDKPDSHEGRIHMILDRLEANDEFIVRMLMNYTPVEMRSVDVDKDEDKDVLTLVGSPGVLPSPGTISVYLTDTADNGFGTADRIRVGRDIEGYLVLEDWKDPGQLVLDTIDTMYRRIVDLGADVILYNDQSMDILEKRKLDADGLKQRNIDKEIDILIKSKK
jgi:hypothetical protein